MERRLDGFVECRVQVWLRGSGQGWREGREARRIPGHAEAIDVEEAVADCYFGFGGVFSVGVVGEEFREVVLVDLLAQSMGWCWWEC